MPTAEELEQLGREATFALADVRKGIGGSNAATRELDHLASQMLRGQMKKYQGKYRLQDKYSDRPNFSQSPYRTSARYSSGKAGRRSVGRQFN
jgi:hypothetical protein